MSVSNDNSVRSVSNNNSVNYNHMDIIDHLGQEVVVNYIFPYINPNITAPVSKSWQATTLICEDLFLLSNAKKVCNDFELEQLMPRALTSCFKELKNLTQGSNQEENQALVLAKMKEFLVRFKEIARKGPGLVDCKVNDAPDYNHFRKRLIEESVYSPCYVQLLKKHNEHRRLIGALKVPAGMINYLKHRFQDNTPPLLTALSESINEVSEFPFPMTNEQEKKMEKTNYLCLALLSGMQTVFSESKCSLDEQEFNELKKEIFLKLNGSMSQMKKIYDLIEEDQRLHASDLKSLPYKEVIVRALHCLYNPKNLEEDADDMRQLVSSVFTLTYHLNIFK